LPKHVFSLSVDFFGDSPKSVEENICKMRNELKEEPDNIKLHRTFAEFLLSHQNSSRIIEAKDSLYRVLKHDRGDLEARILEIRAYRLSNKIKKAFELADSLDNYFPENPSVLEELGRIYLEKKYFTKAEQCLEKAYKIDRTNGRIGRAYWNFLHVQKDFEGEFVGINYKKRASQYCLFKHWNVRAVYFGRYFA